ncbi:PQQ-binding-like beta-propeller repeat protein [Streptomyces ehimensis]|uniref:PQQ-binding-like beta-propeller repeat protein n=1 Tax=Streptomyces ehimensis TaxID=68195 RepID=A0ABV9BGX1_9ACTN
MSQPPQPPQPPQGPPGGGFGAPQDPRGGFGAPQPPQGPPPGAAPQAPPPTMVSPPVPPPAGAPQQPPQPPQPGAAPQTPPQAPPPTMLSTPAVPPPGAPQNPPPGAPAVPPAPGAAPQAPPPAAPGGYGYPAAPAAPGYGYPGPAGAPGGYGYPGAPGAPGQPQPQYGGYGPTAQFPAGAPTGAPGGNGPKKRMALIAGAVAAVLVVAGGGIWFATKGGGGDDDKKTEAGSSAGTQGGQAQGGGGKAPKTVDGKLLFTVDQPKADDLISVKGMWATDKVFAKADIYKIVGYGLSGGKQWEVPLDGEICWPSQQTTADGKTALVVKDSKANNAQCTQVVALDLNNGKKLWQKSAKSGDQDLRFGEVTVGGGTVAAGGTSGGAAWSLDGGKELWKPKPGDDCRDDGYGGGSKLVAVRRCGDYARPQMQVQTLDPASGAPKSVYKAPAGLQWVHIASTDPLVIAVDAGGDKGSGASDFLAIDDSATEGKLRSKISTGNGGFTPKCPSTNVEGCTKLAVTKDTLFLPSEEHSSGNAQQVGRVNEIVGFDLATGQSRGKAEGLPGSTLTPLGVDKDGYPIGYQDPTYKAGGQVVRIDPKSFKTDVLLKNPAASAQSERMLSPTIQPTLWSQGRLYLGGSFANKPSSVSFGKQYLVMIFGGS